MPVVHSFDPPERFVTGTVGPPGQRTFFLQARTGNRMISVALEKQQVAALAERLETLLGDVEGRGELGSEALNIADNNPLEQPIDEEFRVGTMTLSWDASTARVVLEVFPVSEQVPPIMPGELPPELEPHEMLLLRITLAQTRAFVTRAQRVVSAGRPPCPFCGEPIDPDGHLCVRANGFKRRDPLR